MLDYSSYIACSVVHTLVQRSVAGIEWIAVRRKNQYRVGHRGKVHMMHFPHQIVLMVIILHNYHQSPVSVVSCNVPFPVINIFLPSSLLTHIELYILIEQCLTPLYP